jgi:hypothetical protein
VFVLEALGREVEGRWSWRGGREGGREGGGRAVKQDVISDNPKTKTHTVHCALP